MAKSRMFIKLVLVAVVIVKLCVLHESSRAASGAGSSQQSPTPENPMVWNVDFEGNQTFRNLVLNNQVATDAPTLMRKLRFWNRSGFDFSETEVRRDVVRLERFYQRRGFYHVQVDYEVTEARKASRRNVTFLVDEGEPAMVEQVSLAFEEGAHQEEELRQHSDFTRALRRHSLREGRRYQLLLHSDVEAHFVDVLNEIGYPFARVNVMAEVDEENNSVEVHLHFDPGPVGYIDEILVEGNQTLSEEKIIRQSNLELGDRFRQRDMSQARQYVFGHQLFRFATVGLPEQPRDSTVQVSVRVREYPLRSLQAQIGAGVEEYLRGMVSWRHRNPWRTGHQFQSRIRASFIEQSFDFEYKFPYIFNPNSSIAINPFGQRLKESNYELYRGGITNTFIYQYTRNFTSSVSYEFTRNREELVEYPDFVERPSILYNISALQFSSYYGRALPDWESGWNIRPFAEFSGYLGTGSLQYDRYLLDVRRYINFTSQTQLALRNDFGMIFSGDDKELPRNIRMYSGGTSSVRGWQRRMLGPKRPVVEEDEFQYYVPVGGNAMYAINIELRQQMEFLINNFGMAFFLDGGQVWQNPEDTDLMEMQFGVGGGFRYQSPIGPIRIDLGYKINPSDEDLNIYEGTEYGSAFDYWGIHFSIGQAF